jgi:hypothetical protein
MKEVLKSRALNCYRQVEVWCGQTEGAIAVFSLTDSVVTNQDIVRHNLETGQVSYGSYLY